MGFVKDEPNTFQSFKVLSTRIADLRFDHSASTHLIAREILAVKSIFTNFLTRS
jgi:hypothetical protein